MYPNAQFGIRSVFLAIACATAVMVGVGTATGATAPTVRIAALAPLTVVGSRFQPGERVTLSVRIGRRAPVRSAAVATSLGRIRVRFSPFLATDVCGGYVVVTASGSKGSTASTRRPCLTADPQP